MDIMGPILPQGTMISGNSSIKASGQIGTVGLDYSPNQNTLSSIGKIIGNGIVIVGGVALVAGCIAGTVGLGTVGCVIAGVAGVGAVLNSSVNIYDEVHTINTGEVRNTKIEILKDLGVDEKTAGIISGVADLASGIVGAIGLGGIPIVGSLLSNPVVHRVAPIVGTGLTAVSGSQFISGVNECQTRECDAYDYYSLTTSGAGTVIGLAAMTNSTSLLRGTSNTTRGSPTTAVNNPYSSRYIANTPSTGWKVGDPINNYTKAGNVPTWSTVRSRFWKNEALYNKSAYPSQNVFRMKSGHAPIIFNVKIKKLESMELHHTPIPQRDGGLFGFKPVTPKEHALVDINRHINY